LSPVQLLSDRCLLRGGIEEHGKRSFSIHLLESTLFFHNLEVLFVYATDSDSVTSKIEDELAVTVNADNIALTSCEDTC